jgi:hypothetical protein
MLWYLAHPYSNAPEENFKKVNALAWTLVQKGINVYSPISHTHPIAIMAGKREVLFDYDLWLPLDKEIAQHCDGLFLAPGWDKSKGCLAEKKWFEAMDKPVLMIGYDGFNTKDIQTWIRGEAWDE